MLSSDFFCYPACYALMYLTIEKHYEKVKKKKKTELLYTGKQHFKTDL